MLIQEFALLVIIISASGVMAPGPLFAANIAYGLRGGIRTGLKMAMGHAIVADPAYGIYGEASPNGGLGSESLMNHMAPHRASVELQLQINDMVADKKLPMCLHAQSLSLDHPVTGEHMTWEARTPF